MHIPRRIRRRVPNLVRISPVVWQLPQTVTPIKPPGVLRGDLYIHSQTNPQICITFGANRSSRLTASPIIWICDSLTPPPPNAPGVLWGDLHLSYVHSLTNPLTCTKFGVNRCRRLIASIDFWMCDPLPPPPQVPPGVLRGDLDLAYVHSQMNPQTWSKVGGNRSSGLTASPDVCIFDS